MGTGEARGDSDGDGTRGNSSDGGGDGDAEAEAEGAGRAEAVDTTGCPARGLRRGAFGMAPLVLLVLVTGVGTGAGTARGSPAPGWCGLAARLARVAEERRRGNRPRSSLEPIKDCSAASKSASALWRASEADGAVFSSPFFSA